MKITTEPAIKIDVLRGKMITYADEHIEEFITPELRNNRDAIRCAHEWLKSGATFHDINARLNVLETEYIQSECEKIMEEHEEEMELQEEADAWRDGFGPEIKVGICHQTLDQMSTEDIYVLEQLEKEAYYSDSKYFQY